MFKLVFFVPEQHAEAVKNAVFAVGAGGYQNYDSCAWQTVGTGQFRPRQGSNPFIGVTGHVERVPEARVEVLCSNETVKPAIKALLRVHPYEEPAYEIYEVWQYPDLPPGL